MTEPSPPPGLPLQGILGYLNFSAGKPDPRWQKQVNDAYATLETQGAAQPWLALLDALRAELATLKARGEGAFQDATQAEAVLALTFDRLLPAYRSHHADLLFHQSDRDLFQPGFLIRAFEVVLSQGAPWEDAERITRAALTQLNDYVGYRPVAVLETRPRGEPYDHEKVRPLPLYLRGAGVLHGRYHALVSRALEVLTAADPTLLTEGCFDLNLLDELAVDPRAYDHGHPADRRPNYRFGEWDPHHIDTKGRYRRFVARQLVLDALLYRAHEERGPLDAQEVLLEAAIVLAGTILMATGVSGAGPETHDSTVTLATLVPRIARNREAFYTAQLQKLTGKHRARLDKEAKATKQPFGGARQHVNQYLARHRAAQLQQRHLALLLAEMGYPDASRRQAARIPAASVRLLSEMHLRLTAGQLHVDRGQLTEAARLLAEVEALLHRGIGCGAVLDPWNILGFQGLFPLFTASEDSLPDPRVPHLVHVIEQTLTLYARLLGESAAAGEKKLGAELTGRMKKLAAWWDRFATVEVGDVRRVHGGEAARSAEHVARALGHWRERGAATADLAFWKQHLEGFRSPKAFALVVDALLRKKDYRAAMALSMNWLSQAEEVGLEDGSHSFHPLALRWMLAVANPGQEVQGEPGPSRWPLIRRFLDSLEANADEYASVPRLDVAGVGESSETGEDEEEALYGAAYEGVTYRDSTDDDVEGEVLDSGPQKDFDLEEEGQRLEKRLRFLSTVARLWNIATRGRFEATESKDRADTLQAWLARARINYQGLLALLDAIHEHAVPEPSGSYDSLVEFDRRRVLKEQLLGTTITTCLDTAFAVGALQGALSNCGLPIVDCRLKTDASNPQSAIRNPQLKGPAWEPLLIRIEQALWRGDSDAARQLVPEFVPLFRHEPLLFTPLGHGGHPRQVLRASIAQTILRGLLANLPRLGLVRETYELLRTAWEMENEQELHGPRVTEFDRLFQVGCQAVVEAVVASAEAESPPTSDQDLVDLLEQLIEPFLGLWVKHSRTLRVAVLETVGNEKEWGDLREFIKRHGRELFHARFMTLANLRGVLHRGVGAYLDYLQENEDALHPSGLIEELDHGLARADVERRLQVVLQTLIENYEEYKDYNTTTPQSDYGENLHTLMDFLRLKASYERHAWQLRPLVLLHEVLARKRGGAAVLWQEQVTQLTRERAERHLEQLAALERAHGMHLRTVADRVAERFVKPLSLDRLCALVEPAMEEARSGGGGAAFAGLQRELDSYAETTTGVGLDVPHWLRRLEGEVHRVQAGRTAIANLAEELFRIPRVVAPLADVRRQLEGWRKSGKER
ncbi:MAG: hypothetical protein L0Z62_01820 [Gemmataceae bacterium]|nr:hypothetical protein [Gemmataceae bacterium]